VRGVGVEESAAIRPEHLDGHLRGHGSAGDHDAVGCRRIDDEELRASGTDRGIKRQAKAAKKL